jgi:hypothetical protein
MVAGSVIAPAAAWRRWCTRSSASSSSEVGRLNHFVAPVAHNLVAQIVVIVTAQNRRDSAHPDRVRADLRKPINLRLNSRSSGVTRA